MKKVILTAFVAVAFAFGFTSCNGNSNAENTDSTTADTAAVEAQPCMHEGDSCCADSTKVCCQDSTKKCAGACKHEGNNEKNCPNHTK